MPWVRFTDNFNWHVPTYKGRVTVAFKKGTTKFVTRACAAEALGKGKAEPAERPVKES
jgi:hypothetical protein